MSYCFIYHREHLNKTKVAMADKPFGNIIHPMIYLIESLT